MVMMGSFNTARADRNVFLVDPDVAQCNVLSAFLLSSGCNVRTFPSAEAFLGKAEIMSEGIMLLEQHLTGISGLELQGNLAKCGTNLPIIFISGHVNAEIIVKAIKAGAIDFLENPFSNEALLASVNEAFSFADDNKKNSHWIAVLRQYYSSLTGREQEVMQHVVAGMSSRSLAEQLGISYRTVETHRASLMKKMRANSLPDLVRKYAICQNAGPYQLRGNSTE
jgi:two-component system, LuxR family, response regulator FixJ